MVPLMQQNQMELNDQQKIYLLWAKKTQIRKQTEKQTGTIKQTEKQTGNNSKS